MSDAQQIGRVRKRRSVAFQFEILEADTDARFESLG